MAVGEGVCVLVGGAVGNSAVGVSVGGRVGVGVRVGRVLDLGVEVWVAKALGLGVEEGILAGVAVVLSASAVGLDASVAVAVEAGPTVPLAVRAVTSVGVWLATGDVAWGVAPRPGVEVEVCATMGAGMDTGTSPNTKSARSRTPTAAAPRTPYSRNRRPRVSSDLDRAFSR